MAGISGYALDAARQIIPQYVTGEGAAAERLQSVERMTMWTAGVIQGAIDAALKNKKCVHDLAREYLERTG